MLVRTAVLKGKDPMKLLEEMEIIDQMGKSGFLTIFTHLSQMDWPTLINRTSPFPILGVLGGIFLFFFSKF